MKKILLIASIFLLVLLIYFYVAQKEQTTEPEQKPERTLSEIQITACNAADKGQTCDTKLAKLGIVSKEKCCEMLEKCC